MSMSENDGIAQVVATGGETTIPWDFKIADRGELRIIRTRSGVNEDLVLNSTYTIADDQLNQDAGGVAVLAGSATPAVAGDVYTLLLNTPYARGTTFGTSDFNQAGDYFAAVLNNQFDNIVRMCQRLGRGVAKSLRLPDTDTETIEGSLPGATERAGKALFFDASGNPSVTNDVDTVSAAAAAASAAAAADSAASAAASAAGFTVKIPCRVATTGNITLAGLQTIDTIVGSSGIRVLVWQQTAPAENGIYLMAGGAWTRATDSDTWDELVSQLVTVQEGATYADVNFLCTVNSGGTLGVTAVTYNPWQTIIPANTVTNDKLGDMAGNSVKVRAASSTGDPSDLAIGANQVVGRGPTGDIAAVTIVTPWVAYTPTFTGFGTAASISFFSRRVGDTLEVFGKFTVGTPTAVEARITLGFDGTDGGVTVSSTKVGTGINLAGVVVRNNVGASSQYVLCEPSVGYMTFGIQSAGSAGFAKYNGSDIAGIGNVYAVKASFPITGW